MEGREGSSSRETDTCGGEVGSGVGEESLAAARRPSRGDGRCEEEVATCGHEAEDSRSQSFF
jgi:hypothetical protein